MISDKNGRHIVSRRDSYNEDKSSSSVTKKRRNRLNNTLYIVCINVIISLKL